MCIRDSVSGIGFDGESYFVETDDNIGTEHIGSEWKEFKQHANKEYRSRHCSTEAVQGSIDLLQDNMETNQVEFTKNTLKVLKSGQISVNIKAKVGRKMVSAGQATGAERLAAMRARLAKAKAESNTDES